MRRRGFSLPEVVIAFGLLAVAILSIVAVFMSGLRLQTQAQKVTAATEVARALLEEVRTDGFSTIPATSKVYNGRNDDPTDPDTGFPPAPYPRVKIGETTYELVVETRSHGPDRISVEVAVFWSRDEKVRLESSFVP